VDQDEGGEGGFRRASSSSTPDQPGDRDTGKGSKVNGSQKKRGTHIRRRKQFKVDQTVKESLKEKKMHTHTHCPAFGEEKPSSALRA